MTADTPLSQEIIRLYEAEPDLMALPGLLFEGAARLTDSVVVGYTEFHHRTGELRSLLSMEDDPARRGTAFAAYARHMHSHPFWQYDPAFYGERALRESDCFGEAEFLALPIVQEVFLPSGARHIMGIVMLHGEYSLSLSVHRVVGQAAFGDGERDRFQHYRAHVLRAYRQAQRRTVEQLTPADRLHYAFPELTPRQVEAAAWLAQGKSNEAIAAAMDVSLDTVKAHLKAVFAKIGADSRVTLAALAHTVPPFAQLPPLWTLPTEAWRADGGPPGKAAAPRAA